ncbi:hypothetical protein DPMN_008849 [Dreissena polymorpha]|uniref:Uncharacterized protein n=1 Tax=Dreissena polymorpha TaxID=45954 RepID=A0A9D4RZM1_DREPO|nr:hypothetical protein DPMN_008849 [Dreissena polymorpha]
MQRLNHFQLLDKQDPLSAVINVVILRISTQQIAPYRKVVGVLCHLRAESPDLKFQNIDRERIVRRSVTRNASKSVVVFIP